MRDMWAVLKPDPDHLKDRRTQPLTSCKPFIENTRGVLIHRPRYATIFRIHRVPHLAVSYLCGNGTTGGQNIVFLDEPPASKLLCRICEERAVMASLPSADSICGRHVHVGRVVAQQTCCQATP